MMKEVKVVIVNGVHIGKGIPFAFRRNEVIQSEFPIDFFEPKMNGIVV